MGKRTWLPANHVWYHWGHRRHRQWRRQTGNSRSDAAEAPRGQPRWWLWNKACPVLDGVPQHRGDSRWPSGALSLHIDTTLPAVEQGVSRFAWGIRAPGDAAGGLQGIRADSQGVRRNEHQTRGGGDPQPGHQATSLLARGAGLRSGRGRSHTCGCRCC